MVERYKITCKNQNLLVFKQPAVTGKYRRADPIYITHKKEKYPRNKRETVKPI